MAGDPRNPDFYKRLGIPRNATGDQIKKAYKCAAMRWHPDKNPNDRDIATESFRLVSEAYECLSDSSKRAYYDGKSYILLHIGIEYGTTGPVHETPDTRTQSSKSYGRDIFYTHPFFSFDNAMHIFEQVFGQSLFEYDGFSQPLVDFSDFRFMDSGLEPSLLSTLSMRRPQRMGDFLSRDPVNTFSRSFFSDFDSLRDFGGQIEGGMTSSSSTYLSTNGNSQQHHVTTKTVQMNRNGTTLIRTETKTLQPDEQKSEKKLPAVALGSYLKPNMTRDTGAFEVPQSMTGLPPENYLGRKDVPMKDRSSILTGTIGTTDGSDGKAF